MRYSENVNSAFLYMQIQTQMENSSIGQLTEWFFLCISILKFIFKNVPTTCTASFLQILYPGGDDELLCPAERISTWLCYQKWWNTCVN